MSFSGLRHSLRSALPRPTTALRVCSFLRPATLPYCAPATELQQSAHLRAFHRDFTAMTAMDTTTTVAEPIAPVTEDAPSKRRKLIGREFYESIGSPKTIVAPMVEQSELAWRILSRRHSPPNMLAYTPMFHSRIFSTSPQYRSSSYRSPDLDGNPEFDRPVFVQFCSNDPKDLLAAAEFAAPHCDAVDLNLGCPQGIARKGHYGAFLQEEPELISSMIKTLAERLEVPVTAKIRVLETKEDSLRYAKMCIDSGASVLTVHGRRREQKGHNTGLANWDYIKYIRDSLPAEVVMFANGNILWPEDVDRCLAQTGVDGVMSAEGNLYNPAIFTAEREDFDKMFPRMDIIGREYLEIIQNDILSILPLRELAKEPTKHKKKINELLKDPNLTAIKSHLFKLWHTLLPRHIEIRNAVGQANTRNPADPLGQYMKCLEAVEKVVKEELERNPEPVGEDGKWLGPDTELMEGEVVEKRDEPWVVTKGDGKRYRRNVPWYRCQPYIRPLPEEAVAKGAMTVKPEGGKGKGKGDAGKKRSGEEVEGGEGKKTKLEEGETVADNYAEKSEERVKETA